ncbi:STAS domain-containing protein [Kitasatospora sp. NPDC052896]|uniref:STAS domain-containing protein n=1 Tax=Kitasatospora sp. NPDC052896 TaxID=3364061 RepID=UPI0037C9FF37
MPLLHAIGGDDVTTAVVDCSVLTFCDSAWLNVFRHARLIAEEARVELHLAALPGRVARLLEAPARAGGPAPTGNRQLDGMIP